MTDLILVYNHKYESNIPKLERYYSGKFRKIWHLVPFYRGSAENVIAVYDNSFQFQNFIAQAAQTLRKEEPDRYVFVSDDLLLDPSITQHNIAQSFQLDLDSAFIGSLDDLSAGAYIRGVSEARKTSLFHPGLEIQRELPPPEEASRLVARHLELQSLTLQKYSPYIREMSRPFLKNLRVNWEKFRGNMFHRREQLKQRTKPFTMPYPFVGGYSDIFIVPKDSFAEFAHYCGVLAAARIFVEIALPTALALSCTRIVTESQLARKGFNVWFPPGPWAEMERKTAVLNQLTESVQSSLPKLIENWPTEYVYLHPIKLSKWIW